MGIEKFLTENTGKKIIEKYTLYWLNIIFMKEICYAGLFFVVIINHVSKNAKI